MKIEVKITEETRMEKRERMKEEQYKKAIKILQVILTLLNLILTAYKK